MKGKPKIFGTVTVGERGQVSIPAKVRRLLELDPGDKLIVFSGPPGESKMFSFIPVDEFTPFLGRLEKHISELKKNFSQKTKKKK
ncbi:MAG: AbrB/MazE/SpoVT family DNA-binding domain-containing protein [Candidatus Omnitrophica bacterium]|nr:AbrB/MazE/SpoVT family DNA-binding domain-containing protein [Candidatus Omnitrophota bacterium]MCF7887751.1 AbrB/MazE/SpoVT family DNA-binding domain-containing protein [Candidatus Omnitrophota bacterium]